MAFGSRIKTAYNKVKSAVQSIGPRIQGNNYGAGYNIGGIQVSQSGPSVTTTGGSGGSSGGGGGGGITVVSVPKSSGGGGGGSRGGNGNGNPIFDSSGNLMSIDENIKSTQETKKGGANTLYQQIKDISKGNEPKDQFGKTKSDYARFQAEMKQRQQDAKDRERFNKYAKSEREYYQKRIDEGTLSYPIATSRFAESLKVYEQAINERRQSDYEYSLLDPILTGTPIRKTQIINDTRSTKQKIKDVLFTDFSFKEAFAPEGFNKPSELIQKGKQKYLDISSDITGKYLELYSKPLGEQTSKEIGAFGKSSSRILGESFVTNLIPETPKELIVTSAVTTGTLLIGGVGNPLVRNVIGKGIGGYFSYEGFKTAFNKDASISQRITGGTIGVLGGLEVTGTTSYLSRRTGLYSELRSYAEKLPPEQRAKFYETYKESKSLLGIDPIPGSLDLSRLQLIEKNPQAQAFLREYFSLDKRQIVGGSISQQPQFERGISGTKRPGDIDVYIKRTFFGEKGEARLGAKKAYSISEQLKEFGLKSESKEGKVFIGGEKFIEFHPYKSYLKPNIEQATPLYRSASSFIKRTPEGTKILGLDVQARRKVIGYYLEPVVSGKVRLKDLPAYETIKESLIKTKEVYKEGILFSGGEDLLKPTKSSKNSLLSKSDKKTNTLIEQSFKVNELIDYYKPRQIKAGSSYYPFNDKVKRGFDYYKPKTPKRNVPFFPYKPIVPSKFPPLITPQIVPKPPRKEPPYIPKPPRKEPPIIPNRPFNPLVPLLPDESTRKSKPPIRRRYSKKFPKNVPLITPQDIYTPSFTASALGITAKEVPKSALLGGFQLRPVIVNAKTKKYVRNILK